MSAYTGALQRAVWGRYTPVQGVDPRHHDGTDDPDPFTNEPKPPPGQAGDVWLPQDVTTQTAPGDEPVHHWASGTVPVPTNVPRAMAQQVHQNGMVATHAAERYRPDTIRAYTHATISKTRDYVRGYATWLSGQSVPETMEYLLGGHNGYDARNLPNEVYSADEGRYRLGTRIHMQASYEHPQKQGHDGLLRAYEPLRPQLPIDKPAPSDPPPVIPPSSGTARWVLPTWQTVRSFTPPGESEVSAYTMASDATEAPSDFREDGRL